jgi:hypothetical protein
MNTVTTYIGKEGVNIQAWQDAFRELQGEDAWAYQLTKVKVQKMLWMTMQTTLKSSVMIVLFNGTTTAMCSTIIYEIDGYKSHMLAYVDPEEK